MAYFELRFPESYEDKVRQSIYMTKAGVIDDALKRLKYLIKEYALNGTADDVKLLTAYKTILENNVADFELVKMPVLKDLYNYDNKILNEVNA